MRMFWLYLGIALAWLFCRSCLGAENGKWYMCSDRAYKNGPMDTWHSVGAGPAKYIADAWMWYDAEGGPIRSVNNPVEIAPETDTDGDGIPDAQELENGTDYLDPNDPNDPNEYDPDSTEQDLDGDGIPNADDPDDDGDGISDEDEAKYGTDPGDVANPTLDTDGDGQPDSYETLMGSDPENAASKVNESLDNIQINVENGRVTSVLPMVDGVPDSTGDIDGDGITNANDTDNNGNGIRDWEELYWGQNPLGESALTDSDGDGWSDTTEEWFGFDKNNAGIHPYNDWQPADGVVRYDVENPDTDTDGDGVPDYQEWLFGSNPNDASSTLPDSDSDGWTDKAETYNGTDPNNSASHPPAKHDAASGTPSDDPEGDNDLDGASNAEEYVTGHDMNDGEDTPTDEETAAAGEDINWDYNSGYEGFDWEAAKGRMQVCMERITGLIDVNRLSGSDAESGFKIKYPVDINQNLEITWREETLYFNPDEMGDGTAKTLWLTVRNFLHVVLKFIMVMVFAASVLDLIKDTA